MASSIGSAGEARARRQQALARDLDRWRPRGWDLVVMVLYGLHAILRLHFAQEEEAYAWLASEEPVSVR
jgi:hypothetical protein